MAIYHFSAQIIGRKAGRSAVAAAAYRSASRLRDDRLGLTHDFRAKGNVIHSEILLPEGASEVWQDREKLWNDVEAAELRKDAQLAREVEFAIPREMNQTQGIDLARDFVQAEFVDRGMVADLNVHWEIGADGLGRPHAHVMLTMREARIDENGEPAFGAKVREWNDHALIEHWRERWASHVNERLAELDIDASIDHRRLEAQGIDLEPQNKIGGPAQRIEAEGHGADRAEMHREIARANGERIIENPGIALEAITHTQATFTNRDLAMFVHRNSDGLEQFNAVMNAVRAAPDLVPLGLDQRGQERFSSREMIEVEQRLDDTASLLADRKGHAIEGRHRADALSLSATRGLVLATEQRDALSHITDGSDLSLVVGYAGTGKSAMLGVARQAWDAAGYQVQGLALSGIAAENLESGSGIGSRTIASMEHGWAQGRDQLHARSILVVDEAGMVGTRQMERVLSHAAQAGAKVVLVGDPQQLQAIEAGAAFRALHERHGSVEITQVRRQREDWQREATRDLAHGNSGAAIEAYGQRQMVHTAQTRGAARQELIDRWDAERQASPEASRIILTHTNAEVRELSDLAREKMRASAQLGEDVRLTIERGERDFAGGDRIMFLRNERSLEVKNGTLGTVEAVSPHALTVRLDNGRSLSFDLKDYSHFDHGYAATIHKAQGMTVDHTHVLATPGMDRHGAYVALSRHRDSVQLHYGRDDFADRDKLAATLGRDRGKDMASDYTPASGPEHAARPEHDPARSFAERRGIIFKEKIAEIVQRVERTVERTVERVAKKARGIFDNFRPAAPVEKARDTSADVQPKPPSRQPSASRSSQPEHEPTRSPARAGGLRGAVERYARARDAIRQARAQGIETLPHQREALEQARKGLDAIRPDGAADLSAVFQRNPSLIHDTAQGRSQAAIRAMQLEAEIRMDPFQRADRFVEGLQRLRRQYASMRRDGDLRGAQRAAEGMRDMAKSLERDPQLESVLTGRDRRDLGLEIERETARSLSAQISSSIPYDHVYQLSRGIGLGR